jgi:hypothetical protein
VITAIARHPQDFPDVRRFSAEGSQGSHDQGSPEVAHLLADVERLARANRRLSRRVEALEAVEVAAHRLLASRPHQDKDARERLLLALKGAEGVPP